MGQPSANPLAEFQCTSCGKCCLEGASQLPVVESDIALWEVEAPHILEFVIIRGEPGQRAGSYGVAFTFQKKRQPVVNESKNIRVGTPIIIEFMNIVRNYPISFEHADFTVCPGFLENSSKTL